MGEIYRYDLRCCCCGRFVKPDADRVTPWGRSYDTEPPETEFFCDPCVQKEIEYYVKQGNVPTAYHPAKWFAEVRRRLDANDYWDNLRKEYEEAILPVSPISSWPSGK